MLTLRSESPFKCIMPQLELKSLMKLLGNKWQTFVCWSLVCFHCRRPVIVANLTLTFTPAFTFQCYQPLITNCNRIPVLWGGFRFAPPFVSVLRFAFLSPPTILSKLVALAYFLLITKQPKKQLSPHIVHVCIIRHLTTIVKVFLKCSLECFNIHK